MIILGFCKLRGTHGGAAAYRDPARRAAATGATPVAGATHGRARAGGRESPGGWRRHPRHTDAPAMGSATHGPEGRVLVNILIAKIQGLVCRVR